MSRSLGLDSLSDDELLGRLSTLVDRHRRCEAKLVAHIAEVDKRKLYLGKACSSMFAYCCEVLHLSEHESYLRIACARASRRFPALLDMLADGRLHLSAIAKLAPHLTDDNAAAVLERAVHRSKREVEELCAELSPRPDVAPRLRKLPQARREPAGLLGPDIVPGATLGAAAASPSPVPVAANAGGTAPFSLSPACPAVLEPIAPARYRVEFTASAELRDKLDRARALLRHSRPEADLGEVIDEAVTLLLGKLEGQRFGKTDKPRKSLAETDTSATSRHVPAAVKRAVFARDGGRCTFVDEATGRRCSCTDPGRLEYHHVEPFARGSDHDPAKIELRCRAHNQHQGDLDFGVEKMQRHRSGTSRARERGVPYDVGLPGVRSSGSPGRGSSSERRRARQRSAARRCAFLSISWQTAPPHNGRRAPVSAVVRAPSVVRPPERTGC